MPTFDDSDDEQHDEERRNGSLDIEAAEGADGSLFETMDTLSPPDTEFRRSWRVLRRGEDTTYRLKDFIRSA